jgi:antitoxin MazE
MRTLLRKIGNSRGVLIPAALLAECGIADEIDLRIEGHRLVIEPVQSSREGWFDGYQQDKDVDAWASMTPEVDSSEWVW